MSSPAEERAAAEARQRQLAADRRERELAWLAELVAAPSAALVERALRTLGFREPVAFRLEGTAVEFAERRLTVRQLARLVRGRSSADWTFADVQPLEPVPPRYRLLGEVVELRGELPRVVVGGAVDPGATVAFEIGEDFREWVVEHPLPEGALTDVGYVGTPPPAPGTLVYDTGTKA